MREVDEDALAMILSADVDVIEVPAQEIQKFIGKELVNVIGIGFGAKFFAHSAVRSRKHQNAGRIEQAPAFLEKQLRVFQMLDNLESSYEIYRSRGNPGGRTVVNLEFQIGCMVVLFRKVDGAGCDIQADY